MKAYEIMDALFAYGAGHDYSNTCDTWKAGNPDAEVQKVAVTMFPTVDVIRRAGEWGAQLLIVHEPLYYNHMDRHSREPIEVQKRRLLEQTGMAVFRIHDHMHYHFPDLICQGQMKKLELPGEEMWTGQFDLVRLTLDTPMTPVEVARRVEERFGIAYVRICGTRDVPCTHISGMFGSPRRDHGGADPPGDGDPDGWRSLRMDAGRVRPGRQRAGLSEKSADSWTCGL